MRIAVGWLLGVASAWAALAIWRRIPPFPDIDPADVPDVVPDPGSTTYEREW